ncbi:MAG: DNA polymerase III subunit beta [Gammaproteobacteria bacterium]
MQAKLNKEDLASALASVMGVVEKRQTLPILANVLIDFTDDGVNMTATDLESEIALFSVVGVISSQGKTTVSAKKLNDLVRLLPDGEVLTISLKNNKLNIKTPTSNYNLATLSSDDFPRIDASDEGEEIQINMGSLKKTISSSSFAMGNQDWRHYLNGLYVTCEEGLFTAVATDAHRLAVSNSKTTNNSKTISGIIPRKAVNEIFKFLDEEGECVLKISESFCCLSKPGLIFKSKLIEGKFPDYNQVIPSGESIDMHCNKKELADALARSSILTSDKYKGVRFLLDNSNLTITANNPDQEDAEEVIKVNAKGSLQIAFNVGYIQEILNHLNTDDVVFRFFGEDKSCIIQSKDNDASLYVVMPLLI